MLFADNSLFAWGMWIAGIALVIYAIKASSDAIRKGAKEVMKSDSLKTAARVGFRMWLGSVLDDCSDDYAYDDDYDD